MRIKEALEMQDDLILKSLKYSSAKEKILEWISQLKVAATDLNKER